MSATKLLKKHMPMALAKYRYEPRHPALKALEGVYKVTGYWGANTPMLGVAESLWAGRPPSKYYLDAHGRKARIAPALLSKGFGADRVAKFVEELGERELVFSVRANDILRMSLTPHFTSCMDLRHGGKRIQAVIDVGNADIAIIFLKDKAGHFTSRCLVRLLKLGGELVLGLQKIYGDGRLTTAMVKSALSHRIGVYNIGAMGHLVARSVTRQYRKLYQHLPWVDVQHNVAKKGIGYDYEFHVTQI